MRTRPTPPDERHRVRHDALAHGPLDVGVRGVGGVVVDVHGRTHGVERVERALAVPGVVVLEVHQPVREGGAPELGRQVLPAGAVAPHPGREGPALEGRAVHLVGLAADHVGAPGHVVVAVVDVPAPHDGPHGVGAARVARAPARADARRHHEQGHARHHHDGVGDEEKLRTGVYSERCLCHHVHASNMLA